jgi:hypothetical protein
MKRNIFLTFIFTLSIFLIEIKGQTFNIDLDSILKIEHNTLLADMQGDELNLCCYDLINLPLTITYELFSIKTETYSSESKVQRVTVYRHDSSFVKTYFNKHPQVNRLDLVSGKINSNKLFSNPDIKIGMTKDAVLNIIFKPSTLYAKINRIAIHENELGEAVTMLIFKDDKLTEIQFDSSYDWINKGQ